MKNIAKIKNSGLLLLLSGTLILMGIITGEIFYPEIYTTAQNEISDLGATRPPNSIIYPIPSMIFNSTMVISGVMVILSSVIMMYEKIKKSVWVPIFILGIGVLGVGIFPGDKAPIHGILAMIAFISGAVAAILSSKIAKQPFSFIVIILGGISLTFYISAIFFNKYLFEILGDGGTERWVAYPVIIWLIAFGAYLMGKEKTS